MVYHRRRVPDNSQKRWIATMMLKSRVDDIVYADESDKEENPLKT